MCVLCVLCVRFMICVIYVCALSLSLSLCVCALCVCALSIWCVYVCAREWVGGYFVPCASCVRVFVCVVGFVRALRFV